MTIKPLFLFSTLLVSSAASAHITLEQPSAPAGSYYKATFRVPHGCEGHATTGITIEFPGAFHNAHPMPKAGWVLSTMPRKEIREPASVSWKEGSLPSEWYDEFVVRGQLAKVAPEVLSFTVVQQCGDVVERWDQPMPADEHAAEPEYPAPVLHVTAQPTVHHH